MSKRTLDVRQQSFGFPDEDLKNSLHDQIVLWLKRNAAEICRQLIGWTGTWNPQLIESKRQLAAATVAERLNLLRESLTKEESRLQAIKRCKDSFHMGPNLEAELTFLNSWNGLGEPPAPKLDVRCELERPIPRRLYEATNIVGYVDVVLSVSALRLTAGIAPSDDYGRPYLGVDARRYADWNAYWSDFRSFAFEVKTTIRSLGELIRQLKAYRAYLKVPFYAVSPDSGFAKDITDEGFGFIKYPDAIITFPKNFIRH